MAEESAGAGVIPRPRRPSTVALTQALRRVLGLPRESGPCAGGDWLGTTGLNAMNLMMIGCQRRLHIYLVVARAAWDRARPPPTSASARGLASCRIESGFYVVAVALARGPLDARIRAATATTKVVTTTNGRADRHGFASALAYTPRRRRELSSPPARTESARPWLRQFFLPRPASRDKGRTPAKPDSCPELLQECIHTRVVGAGGVAGDETGARVPIASSRSRPQTPRPPPRPRSSSSHRASPCRSWLPARSASTVLRHRDRRRARFTLSAGAPARSPRGYAARRPASPSWDRRTATAAPCPRPTPR